MCRSADPRLLRRTQQPVADGVPDHALGRPSTRRIYANRSYFASVAEEDSVFEEVLARYFGSNPDPLTLRFIQRGAAPE